MTLRGHRASHQIVTPYKDLVTNFFMTLHLMTLDDPSGNVNPKGSLSKKSWYIFFPFWFCFRLALSLICNYQDKVCCTFVGFAQCDMLRITNLATIV